MFQQFIQKAFISIFFVLTIFGLASAANGQICQPAANGLVSWYQAGNNATDTQGVNNGMLLNGTTFAPGKTWQGFKFDGTDDAVEIPDSASLKPQTITVEAWVRFDNLFGTTSGSAPAGFQYILNKKNNRQSNNFEGYALVKLSNHRFAFTISNDNGVQTTVVDQTQIVEVNRFYHVAGTFDGTTASLYVNGRKVAEAPHTLAISYATRPVFIGSSGETNWDGRMNGVIDELKIYNRALTDLEIQTNYLNDSCRAAADLPANLISWHGGDGNARDFTNVNNGFPINNPKFIIGKAGQAFDFNGSYVQFGTGGIFRGQSEGTIETWVRPRTLPNGPFGLSAIWAETEQTRSATRFGIYYDRNSKIAVYSNFSNVSAVSPAAIPQNQWTHVAATYKAGETVKLTRVLSRNSICGQDVGLT